MLGKLGRASSSPPRCCRSCRSAFSTGRIGGATVGAVAGLNQQKLKGLGWSSNASADLYGKMERPGIKFSAKMLRKL